MSISEVNSDSSEINKTLEDRKDFLFLSSLFLFTSSMTTYIYMSLSKEFLSLGLIPQELTQMQLLLLPQYLKIFLCPLLDTFFIRKIGRRKTYIIAMLGISTLFCFIFSFIYPKLMVELKVSEVRNLALLQLITVILLEIVTESWIVDYIYDDNYKFAAALKYSVYFIGQIATQSFFHQAKTYFLIMSVVSMILLIYASSFKTENDSFSSKMTCKSLFKRGKSFFSTITSADYQIKFYFIFFSLIGYGSVEDIIEQSILQQQLGYTTSLSQLFKMLLIVIIGTGLTSLVLMKYKIFPIYLIVAVTRNLNNLLLLIIYNYFFGSLENFHSYYQLINQFIKAIQFMLIYILVYENTLQKLSATMMILQLLVLKFGQDANLVLSQYLFATCGSPTDSILGIIIQIFNLVIFIDYREKIFYK